MIVLPNDLHETDVVDSEINSMFTAIGTEINTTKLTPKSFDSGAVQYQHLSVPPNYALSKKAVYPDLSVGAALFGGFAPIQFTEILFDPGVHSAGGYPTVLVNGIIYYSDISYTINLPTMAAVGYSTDNGVTWTVAPGSSRPFGFSCGQVRRVFDTGSMSHYMTGAPGYRPVNMVYDRGVELVAAFGGDIQNAPLTGVNRFCLMLDTLFPDNFYAAEIRVNGRDNTQ